ncbi:MAG: histidinol-phosphate transaminase [Myxococcales bacterium]|nr:histidinol-phosphate transaminase [Myxococcales bacterium]MCB9578072.1 histidinol-phosphate transaminase [Polyangiaceae bacterium]
MPELSLAQLLRPELRELSAYSPDTGSYAVRLDANEAPDLLSPAARARLAEVAARTAWNRYPDPRARKLRAAIAARSAVSEDEVLVGVGSDEVISLLLTVLCQPRGRTTVPTLLTTTPTFVMYKLSAKVRGQRVLEVPLDADWDISVPAMTRALSMAPPNLVFVASPNNPTGTQPDPARLDEIIEAAAGALVVIDEAYADYAARRHIDLYRKHENVALLRTLSKVGFAALRLGWLIGRPELVAELDKARLPYNVATPTQELATVVLEELSGELARVTSHVMAERERVSQALAALPGVEPTPSEANFIWLSTPLPAERVFEGLKARGVLVRSFHQRGGRLAHRLRVTIGTREQNDAFLAALGDELSR